MLLIREKTTSQATYGTLKVDDFECKTVELAYRGNKRNISCIPKGNYKYRVLNSSRAFKYQHIEIMGVPNRHGIKIHVANFVSQLKGCIAVGKIHADIDNDGIIDVTSSKDTLQELLQTIPKQGIIKIQ